MVVSAKSDRLKVHRQKCVVSNELDESETVTSVTSVPLPDSASNPGNDRPDTSEKKLIMVRVFAPLDKKLV